jgi:hypothetical protein
MKPLGARSLMRPSWSYRDGLGDLELCRSLVGLSNPIRDRRCFNCTQAVSIRRDRGTKMLMLRTFSRRIFPKLDALDLQRACVVTHVCSTAPAQHVVCNSFQQGSRGLIKRLAQQVQQSFLREAFAQRIFDFGDDTFRSSNPIKKIRLVPGDYGAEARWRLSRVASEPRARCG